MPEQLRGPELPDCLAHVWQWFGDLSAARGGNGWGPNPIGYADVAAWAALTRRDPTAAEVDLLMALDRRYLAAVASRRKAGE